MVRQPGTLILFKSILKMIKATLLLHDALLLYTGQLQYTEYFKRGKIVLLNFLIAEVSKCGMSVFSWLEWADNRTLASTYLSPKLFPRELGKKCSMEIYSFWSISPSRYIRSHTRYHLGSWKMASFITTDRTDQHDNSKVHNQPHLYILTSKQIWKNVYYYHSSSRSNIKGRKSWSNMLEAKQDGRVDMFAVFFELID